MKTSEISMQRLVLQAGVLIFVCLIVYFMLMNYMNLIHIMELRALNFFILLGGIFLAFRHYRLKTKKKIEYLPGFLFGCFISAVSVIPFALFAGLYFSFVDPLLLEQLKGNSPMMGAYITPLSIITTVIIEGMCSGLIISFSFVQYYQNDSTHV